MATRHQTDYRTLASLSRINLLHALHVNGAQTVTELAAATGLHHNTAREHLHRLIDAGFVDSETIPTTTKGRPQLSYRAARGAASPAHQARVSASERRSDLIRRLLPLSDVSRESTPVSRQLDALDDHMDQCGFDAELSTDRSHMTMHDCPFADLAKANPQVCEVHFELVKDALDIGDGPIHAQELHPFSEPRACRVDLESSEISGR
ncbi:MAG: helix-turn-helix domain-containing protein [Terrimesophilobacter sp.]